ncbi:dipeptidase PepE [Nonlabens marinus]|uniref:Alpha-aspartyl dipeptidase Peptidase E n=1 Tax=Nonlabens marinus S1-08 TaxID=1454201 RepID=W8VQR0_9FLAO|nr:dipeptidase PepE [Nonlabens marinus]BAO55185.1 alpha-aspartyl dipeptidase Peptidase E [Nonlabens marinus S1-08]
MRNMIIASTSTIYGSGYLEYLTPVLSKRLNAAGISEVLFIPFARPGGITHDEYTSKAAKAFEKLDVSVQGIHTFQNPGEAIEKATAIFTGGGNTFQLVKMLHDLELMMPLRKAIYNGCFYLGTSAGSNICGLNMKTTNDMPVVEPQSFKTTGAIGYNINAHYQDPIENDTHMGETREERIKEFHVYNSITVVGLREGSYIDVNGSEEILQGPHQARIFRSNTENQEVDPGFNFATL